MKTVLEGSPRDLIKASELRRKNAIRIVIQKTMLTMTHTIYYKYLCGFLIPNNVTKKKRIVLCGTTKTSSCWQFEKNTYLVNIISLGSRKEQRKSDTREAKTLDQAFA